VATFVTGDGTQLYYERRGRGRRVYALCGGPAGDFRYLADDLAPLAGEYELVFNDYRGSGRSASAPPDTYTLEQLADDLDELRSELGDDKIVVIGHSMGGFVGLYYALRHPAHCERLVLVGAFPCTVPQKMMGPTFRALGWARTTKMAGRALWWLLASSWQPESHERRRRLYAIWATLQEGRPAVRAREIERERELGLPLENDNVRPLQQTFRSLDLIDDLPAIAGPVLVLYGDRDAMAVWGAGLFREQLPDVRITVLDDTGHDPFFEAPDASFDAVRSFLNA
jgi:proline iminopeptidase